MNDINVPFKKAELNLVQHNQRKQFGSHANIRCNKHRILVVDADITIRETVAKFLESFGYKVSKAEDGIATMSHLATAQYELVVTSYNIPVMNGYRLTHWIKQETPLTKVIIMTAACQAEVHHLMATGLVDTWLFKPFGCEELRESLNYLGLPAK